MKYISAISFCWQMSPFLLHHSEYLFLIDHHCEPQSESFDTLIFVRFFWCSCRVIGWFFTFATFRHNCEYFNKRFSKNQCNNIFFSVCTAGFYGSNGICNLCPYPAYSRFGEATDLEGCNSKFHVTINKKTMKHYLHYQKWVLLSLLCFLLWMGFKLYT